MRHWTQLASRNWLAKRIRTLGALLAVALGTGVVVWVTCCQESVRRTVLDWAEAYVGSAHVSVSAKLGKYDQIPQRLTKLIEAIDGVEVATPRLLQRFYCQPIAKEKLGGPYAPTLLTDDPEDALVDLHGLDLTTEFQLREYPIVAGRMLKYGDARACVLEADFAEQWNVGVGAILLVWASDTGEATEVPIVGLFDRKRLGRLQKPLALMPLPELQRLTNKYALATTIDVKLTDGSEESVRRAARQIDARVRQATPAALVRTAEARMKQIEFAQQNQGFVLVILSCVAILTSLFIILSTLSMGMVERVRRLGLMRCVGMTRSQLARLMLIEVFPLGVVGVLAGIPIGLGLTALTIWLVPDYVGSFAVSRNGILLATVAGLATTAVAAIVPAIASCRISPLEAAHPHARKPRAIWLVLAAIAAAGLLRWQHNGLVLQIVRDRDFLIMAIVGVVVLYLGYAFLAPPAVRVIAAAAVHVAARGLAVRTRLLQDQVGYAVWRSAGICCGLMVGLSLIVALAVVHESVSAGWQFPKEFPSAYFWSYEQLPARATDGLDEVAGLGEYTVANAINVIVQEKHAVTAKLQISISWFLGTDPDTFFDMVRLEFVEGDLESSLEKLREGGYVIIADDFAASRDKHIGDKVGLLYETRGLWRQFTVAGVVRSPSIDIAAGYFQLQTEYNVAAAGSVIGTNRDLQRMFRVNGMRVLLFNFDLPDEPVPPDWPPGAAGEAPGTVRLPSAYYDELVPLDRRWRRWREQEVTRAVKAELGAPAAFAGVTAELKDQIDGQLGGMLLLLTAIPGVALVVAALGVANLMTANVTARERQIAIMRAVGATRGMVLRMVVGEALVLGLLGSGMGLLLGIHLAMDITTMIGRMWGFYVDLALPWGSITVAIVLTVGLCILAGVLPARHASRTNIVDALHVA